MFTSRPTPDLNRAFQQASQRAELALYRQLVRVNRTLARGRRWLQPVANRLWVLPLSFMIGLVGMLAIRIYQF